MTLDFISQLKSWYNEPNIKNLTFEECETGVYVRFQIGYRWVCNFEKY